MNLGRSRDRWTFQHIAIKDSLYRKAVQEHHILISGDTLMYKNFLDCLGPMFKQVLSGQRLCIPDKKVHKMFKLVS